MNIDYCAGVGSFPFRRVPHSEPEALVRLMDTEGIDMALVSSFESILYRNVQAGNELLTERLRGLEDRLVGAAVVNPAYARAIEDATLCVSEWNMKALRLMPSFHGYRLADDCARSLMGHVEQLGVPVSIVMRIEDERQRHWLIDPPAIQTEDLSALVGAFPDVHFVLERPSTAEVYALADQFPYLTNWSFEISGRFMLPRPFARHLGALIDVLGPARILLGTDAPLQYPRGTFLKLTSLNLDDEAERKIRCENAQRLLRLSPYP